MRLHAVPRHHDGSPLYCGPAAIVAVTGCEPSHAHAWLNDYRNRLHPRYRKHRRLTHKAVGTEHAEVMHALQALGCTVAMEAFAPGQRPTLARFAQAEAGTLIVEVSRHWVVLRDGWFVDSRHRTPQTALPGGRRQVRSVIRVGPPSHAPSYPPDWDQRDEDRLRAMASRPPRVKRFALTCPVHGWERPSFERRPRTYKGWCKACAAEWRKRHGNSFRARQDYRGSLAAAPNVKLLDQRSGAVYTWVPGKGYVGAHPADRPEQPQGASPEKPLRKTGKASQLALF